MAVIRDIAQWDMLRRMVETGVASPAIFKDQDLMRRLQEWNLTKPSPPPTYSQQAKPTTRKVQLALDRAIVQLPMRLTYKVETIRFGPDGSDDPQFEVVFKGGKVITFDNLDTFPTDADIGRIAVECP
jgi:hypothetical protein